MQIELKARAVKKAISDKFANAETQNSNPNSLFTGATALCIWIEPDGYDFYGCGFSSAFGTQKT